MYFVTIHSIILGLVRKKQRIDPACQKSPLALSKKQWGGAEIQDCSNGQALDPESGPNISSMYGFQVINPTKGDNTRWVPKNQFLGGRWGCGRPNSTLHKGVQATNAKGFVKGTVSHRVGHLIRPSELRASCRDLFEAAQRLVMGA